MKTKKPDDRYLSAFCRELYMIIASGITADEGLEMMAEDCRDKKEKELLAGMVRAMSGGAMLSGAIDVYKRQGYIWFTAGMNSAAALCW